MLKIRHLPVKSFGENIAYIHRDCTLYKVDDINKVTKLELHKGGKTIFAFLQITESDELAPDEIGLNDEAYTALNMSEGSSVHVSLATPSISTSALHNKISGNVLSSAEYSAIINDIDSGRYTKMDVAAFLVACSVSMSPAELVALTEAMISKKILHWDDKVMVVEQNSLGGVPGNKTDLIVMAIVASYGLPMAKTCVHSMSACADVADTMETMANIDLTPAKFQKYVRENNASVVCSDSLGVSNVERMLHSVRSQLGINQNELAASAMLAMKISSGVTHLVLDVPVGPNARMRTANEALHFKKQIEYVGDMLGMVIDVVISDGSEPIGNGIGAVLEARDVMKVLRNYDDAPRDLREKALFLAGRVIELDPNVRGGQGYAVAEEILDSGRAYEAFQKIVNTQGVHQVPNIGPYAREVVAPYDGIIKSINNDVINKIGIYSGATQCLGSGIDLNKKTGDRVKSGDVLYTVYSCNAGDFDVVSLLVEQNNGYEIEAD